MVCIHNCRRFLTLGQDQSQDSTLLSYHSHNQRLPQWLGRYSWDFLLPTEPWNRLVVSLWFETDVRWHSALTIISCNWYTWLLWPRFWVSEEQNAFSCSIQSGLHALDLLSVTIATFCHIPLSLHLLWHVNNGCILLPHKITTSYPSGCMGRPQSEVIYVCMYMYVCMYVCMYLCMHACTYLCMHVCNVCIYVCVCVYVCMYVCMYACDTGFCRIFATRQHKALKCPAVFGW